MISNSQNNANFDITRGDTFFATLLFKEPDPASPNPANPNYIPMDVTGFTFLMEVRDKPGGNFVAATVSSSSGFVITDATNGVVTVTIPASATKNFPVPKAAYQIQRTDQYGNIKTISQGWFNVNVGVING